MHAVIKTGGKQYRVKTGEYLRVESLDSDVGSEVSFDEVLLVGEGEDARVGAPFVEGVVVKAEILSHGRGDKVMIIKHRRRKHSHKTQGHRQNYTEIKITDIVG